MASFIGISSPMLSSRTPHLAPSRLTPPSAQLKAQQNLLLVKCLSGRPSKDPEPEATADTTSLPPPPSTSTSTSGSISSYSWCAGLGALGFVETGYLAYLKLTNSDAFCPVGGGTCGDILNSDYAVLFGVPLPLFGMLSYGLVTALALQLAGKDLPFGIDKSSGRFILLGTTTSMASASAYFFLFFTTLKIFGLEEIKKVVGLQLCIASLVVASLSTSYNPSQPASTSLAMTELEYFTTEITTPSSPFTLSLAKHLRSIGAKMYGAFWCSHCLEQKQMFGHEAAKLLDYVECFPDGYKNGTKIAKACTGVGIEGFPTWVINGEVLSGEKELSELASLSGFQDGDFNQQS
ncbi:hypothetical protein RJ639_022984 [Escallonia herrerae]|uniref:Vitamin K epoxide reductase domain-containing protein n=2 Tax=Escallonia herrerae TaxID=1293975 RepID=A0AA88V144_9ASTE|nr:hypothetical protein RJ639_022984 [Escallonia herrerae]